MAEDEDGYCEKHEEGTHCECWWDGEACCACGAPGMTEDERRAQGMDD